MRRTPAEQRQPNTPAWRAAINDSPSWAVLHSWVALPGPECLSIASTHVPSLIAAVVWLSRRTDLFVDHEGQAISEDPADLLARGAEWHYVGGEVEEHIIYWPGIAAPDMTAPQGR